MSYSPQEVLITYSDSRKVYAWPVLNFDIHIFVVLKIFAHAVINEENESCRHSQDDQNPD